MKSKLLIVDDEIPIAKYLKRALEKDGHDCDTANSVDEAKVLMKNTAYDLIITDLKMPKKTGLDLLKFAAEFYPMTGRIMMTGYSTMEAAHEAMKIGVYGYLLKPLDNHLVRITIQNALRHMLLENQMYACLEESKKEVLDKNKEFEAIFNNLDTGIILVDNEHRVINKNRAIELMFPETRETKIEYCFDLIPGHPAGEKCADCPLHIAFETKTAFFCERLIQTDTGVKEFKVSALPLFDSDNRPEKGIMLYNDITEILENQKVVSETNKLAAVGQLASGVAHEINTPIQFVGDNINYLKETFNNLQPLLALNQDMSEADHGDEKVIKEFAIKVQEEVKREDLEFILEDVPEAIQQSLDGVNRISGIVKAMKNFSHPDEEEKIASNINELIETTLTVCRNEWKYQAKIKLNLDPDLPLVECLPSQINQVILILVVNAAHSIEEKKDENNGAMGEIHISSRKNSSERVEIEISDTGKGIPLDIQDKIFQAFFTTKKKGKGTGQGLALAQKIITRNHNGELSFESAPGKGTSFTITLPVSDN